MISLPSPGPSRETYRETDPQPIRGDYRAPADPVLLAPTLALLLVAIGGRYSLDRAGAGWLSWLDLRLVGLAVAFAAIVFDLRRTRTRPTGPPLAGGWLVAGCLFFGYQIGSGLWSPADARVGQETVDLLSMALLTVGLYLHAGKDPQTVVRRVLVFFWGTAIVFAVAALTVSGPGAQGRFAAFGGGPNVFVRIQVLGLIAGLALHAIGRPRGIAWTAPLLVVSALLSGSRGGLVAGIVVGTVIVLVADRRARRLAFAGVAISTAATVVVYELSAPVRQLVDSRFIGQTVEQGYTSGRTSIWAQTVQLALDHPLIGTGVDGFRVLVGQVSGIDYPHNYLLAVAAEGGAIGLILLGAAAALWVLAVRRAPTLSVELVAMLAGAGYVALASLFSGDYYDARLAWCFAALAAVLARAPRSQDAPSPTRPAARVAPARRGAEGSAQGLVLWTVAAVVSAAAVVAAFGVAVAHRQAASAGSTATCAASQQAPASPQAPAPQQIPTSPQAPSSPASAAADPAAGLRTPAQWLALFAPQWAADRATAQRLTSSTDSWDHYNVSYSIDALTAAFRAGGDRGYLLEALTLTERVAAGARPSSSLPNSQYHDGYLGWASDRDGGQEVPLYESYFWRYGAAVLRVLHDTPGLLDDPQLNLRYQHLLAFVERNVVEKWFQRGANDTIYRSRTHLAAHWALIALDLSVITTDDSRRARYRQIVEAIDHALPGYGGSLHQQFQPTANGGYFWSDVWGACTRPGQDVAHGNGVVAYLVEAHDTGVDWSDADLARLVVTLNTVIWPVDGAGSAFVDGSGVGTGWFSDGFVKLGRYDAGLQRRLESHQPANAQFYANGALNAMLLGRPAAGPASPA